MSTQKGLSLFGAIMMNVNLMVGASAFIGPAMMAEYAHNASFYGWLWAGLIFFPVVWSVAQITKLFPGKGSFYSYSKNGISNTAGFVSGWVYFLGYVSIGSLQLLSLNEILVRNLNMPSLMTSMNFINIVFLAVLLLLAFMPIHIIEKIQSGGTLFKLTPLMIVLFTIPFYFNLSAIPSITQTSPTILLPTVPMAIFGFWGFEGVCSVSHLIKGDKNSAAKAVLYGFIAAASIYLFFHLGLLLLMGAKGLKADGVTAFVNYLGMTSPNAKLWLKALVKSAIFVAHINAIFGGIIANGSMFCAMAEEKLVFMSRFLSTRTKATRPFGAAIAHVILLFSFVTFIASKEVLNAMSNLGVLTAFFMTLISLYLLQNKNNDYKGQIVSILGLASCLFLGYHSWMITGGTTATRLLATSPFLGILFLGYFMYTQTRKKTA